MDKKEGQREIDLLEYWKIIVKRKGIIVPFTAALVFLTGIFSFLATPVYKATTTLLIEEESSRMLSIEETFGYQSRIVQDLRYFNTQLKLLTSKSLVEKVIRKMNLLARPEFKSKYKKAANGNPPSQSSLDSYALIAKEVQRKIDIKPLRETKLLELSYKSRTPSLAAEVVNSLAEEFITYSIERRYETTQQASDFLSEQIANLREELANEERELQRYSQEKGLFFLSNAESTTGNKFADLNQAYNQAIIDRVNSESAYREIKGLDVDSIPQFVNNSVVGQLRTDYIRAKNDYDEKIKKFKPDYPEMIQLKARLDSMRNDLRKAVDTAEAEYQSALKRESSLRALLEKQKIDVAKMNTDAIRYNNLKIEVETKRRLFNSLIERQNETLVSSRLGGLKTSNISIIDKAEVPKYPVSPKKKLNILLALILGLFGGAALCFFVEYLDNTIKGPEDVEHLVGVPSLGIIPHFSPDGDKKKNAYFNRGDRSPGANHQDREKGLETAPRISTLELINYYHPTLAFSEYYRTVRTSILFSRSDKPPKCIAFTSAMPQEGKTSTVVNIAVSFAQLQEKVLVIEADMRRPRLHNAFNVRNIKGLSSYLTGKLSLKEAIQMTSIDNIWVLPCGPIPPNPAELLNSQKMKHLLDEVREVFDIVLIDTPPILAVIDPIIISSITDGVIVVVHVGKTTRKPFQDAVAELKKHNITIFGTILNDVKIGKSDYYYREYYRPHETSYSKEKGEENP